MIFLVKVLGIKVPMKANDITELAINVSNEFETDIFEIIDVIED